MVLNSCPSRFGAQPHYGEKITRSRTHPEKLTDSSSPAGNRYSRSERFLLCAAIESPVEQTHTRATDAQRLTKWQHESNRILLLPRSAFANSNNWGEPVARVCSLICCRVYCVHLGPSLDLWMAAVNESRFETELIPQGLREEGTRRFTCCPACRSCLSSKL